MRDNIYHWGHDPNIIFVTENGPGVSSNQPPFSDFSSFVWGDEISQANQLGNNVTSLFYFFNRITAHILETADLFKEMLEKTFELPIPVSDEHRIYIRGPGIKYLNNIEDNLRRYWIRPIN